MIPQFAVARASACGYDTDGLTGASSDVMRRIAPVSSGAPVMSKARMSLDFRTAYFRTHPIKPVGGAGVGSDASGSWVRSVPRISSSGGPEGARPNANTCRAEYEAKLAARLVAGGGLAASGSGSGSSTGSPDVSSQEGRRRPLVCCPQAQFDPDWTQLYPDWTTQTKSIASELPWCSIRAPMRSCPS